MECATTTLYRLTALEDDFAGHRQVLERSFRDTFFVFPELVQQVALLLDCNDWKACCFVSRQWHQQWCPYLWKVIKDKQPRDLSRHGRLIRELDLNLSHGHIKVSHIRDHCLRLTSLRLVICSLDGASFEDQVFGLRPMAINGFLSNSLVSLEVHFGSQGCQAMLSPLIKARDAGYLQNLRSFGAATCVNYAPKADSPTPLSSVLTFLGAFPGLESFSTGNSPVQDDLLWTAMEMQEHIGLFPYLRHLGLEPETAVVFEKMVITSPGVTELALHGLSSDLHVEVLPLISKHYSNLTFFSFRQPPQVVSPMTYESETDLGMDMNIPTGAMAGTPHNPELVRLLRSLPRLESLEVLGGTLPLGAAMAIVETCPSFKSLRTCSASVSITGLQYMLEECENLKILDLDTHLPNDFFFEGSRVRYSYAPSPTTPTRQWTAPLERWTVGSIHFMDEYCLEAFRNRVDYQLNRLRFLKIQDARLISLADLSDNIPKELALPGGFGATENWKFHSLEELHLSKFENFGSLSTKELERLRLRMPKLRSLVINGSEVFQERSRSNVTNEEDNLQEAAGSYWDEFD